MSVLVSPEDERCGSDGDDVSIAEAYAILVAQDVVHVESACARRGIAQDELHLSSFVGFDANDAMACVDAGVGCLDGAVGIAAVYPSAEYVFAFL